MDQRNYDEFSPPSYTSLQVSNSQVTAGAAPSDYVVPASAPTPYSPPHYPPSTSQYPPTNGHAPSGQPYVYSPPPPGYPPQQGYDAPQFGAASVPRQPRRQQRQQQQQQQQVVVVRASSERSVSVQRVQSFAWHIVFACLIFWCCNWLFGLIAFILAAVASCKAVSDPAGARTLGRASIGLSIAGIIVTVVVVVSVLVSLATSPPSCPYKLDGVCYRHRKYVGYGHRGHCYGGTKISTYCYYYDYQPTRYGY